MRFRWDSGKARTNARKHGVDFADAVGVLEDPLGLTSSDPIGPEERFAIVGVDVLGRPQLLPSVYSGFFRPPSTTNQ